MTRQPGVRLPASVLRDIVAHARRTAPEECCGLLLGSAGNTGSTGSPLDVEDADVQVEGSVPARNLRRSPTRYLVDPADHFAAIRTARQQGRAVIGAYHSHPAGPPDASATDEREASDTDFLYVIVSVATGAAKVFRPSAGGLREMLLTIGPDA